MSREPIRTPINEIIRDGQPPGNHDMENYQRALAESGAPAAQQLAQEDIPPLPVGELAVLAAGGWNPATRPASPFWQNIAGQSAS